MTTRRKTSPRRWPLLLLATLLVSIKVPKVHAKASGACCEEDDDDTEASSYDDGLLDVVDDTTAPQNASQHPLTRRRLRDVSNKATVSRQGHGGNRDDDCRCRESGGSAATGRLLAYATAGVCLVVIAATVAALRGVLVRQRHAAAERWSSVSEQAARKSRRAADVARAKAALREVSPNLAVRSDDDATFDVCPVCFDALFSENDARADVVAPVNCAHAFHRACLVRWIDTAIIHGAAAPPRVGARALECPTCAASMLPSPPSSSSTTAAPEQRRPDDRRERDPVGDLELAVIDDGRGGSTGPTVDDHAAAGPLREGENHTSSDSASETRGRDDDDDDDEAPVYILGL